MPHLHLAQAFTVHKKNRLAHIKDGKLSVKEELLYIFQVLFSSRKCKFVVNSEEANLWRRDEEYKESCGFYRLLGQVITSLSRRH